MIGQFLRDVRSKHKKFKTDWRATKRDIEKAGVETKVFSGKDLVPNLDKFKKAAEYVEEHINESMDRKRAKEMEKQRKAAIAALKKMDTAISTYLRNATKAKKAHPRVNFHRITEALYAIRSFKEKYLEEYKRDSFA